MASTIRSERTPERRSFLLQFKVPGVVALLIFAIGGWIAAGFWLLFQFVEPTSGEPEYFGYIAVPMVVVFTTAFALGLRHVVREVTSLNRDFPPDALETVVGELPHLETAASVETVTERLERLSEIDVPYTVVAIPEEDGEARVIVTFRDDEMRWRTLLTRGRKVFRWRMVIRLDARRGTYRFTEYTSVQDLSVGVSGRPLSLSWSGHRGKQFGTGRVTHVWAAGQVESPEGRGQHGRLAIRPAGAKVPVFTILRAYGWRPRFMPEASRVFEI